MLEGDDLDLLFRGLVDLADDLGDAFDVRRGVVHDQHIGARIRRHVALLGDQLAQHRIDLLGVDMLQLDNARDQLVAVHLRATVPVHRHGFGTGDLILHHFHHAV